MMAVTLRKYIFYFESVLISITVTYLAACQQKKIVNNYYPEPRNEGEIAQIPEDQPQEEPSPDLQAAPGGTRENTSTVTGKLETDSDPVITSKPSADSDKLESLPTSDLFAIDGTSGGSSVGNGGDVLECPEGNKIGRPALELYDYSEMHTLYKKEYERDASSTQITAIEQGLVVLKRLQKIDPHLHIALQHLYKTMVTRITYVPSFELHDIKDSKEIGIPIECKLKQVAVQQKLSTSAIPEIFIAEDIFNKLSRVDQGGLLLHEVIYRYFLDNFQVQDSKKVRYLNGLLGSKSFSHMKLPEYFYHLGQMGINYKHTSDIEIEVENAQFTPKGALFSAIAAKTGSKVNARLLSFEVTPGSLVEFWSNDTIKAIRVNDLAFTVEPDFLVGQIKNARLEFYPEYPFMLYKMSFDSTTDQDVQDIGFTTPALLDPEGEPVILPISDISFFPRKPGFPTSEVGRIRLKRYIQPVFSAYSEKEKSQALYLEPMSHINFALGSKNIILSANNINKNTLEKPLGLYFDYLLTSNSDTPINLSNDTLLEERDYGEFLNFATQIHIMKMADVLTIELDHKPANPSKYFQVDIYLKNGGDVRSFEFNHAKRMDEIILNPGENLETLVIHFVPYGNSRHLPIKLSFPKEAWNECYFNFADRENENNSPSCTILE